MSYWADNPSTTRRYDQIIWIVRALLGFHHNIVPTNAHLQRCQEIQPHLTWQNGLLNMTVVNIPDIRSVINLGVPHNLDEFVQESGRVGRDVLDVESI